MYVLAGAQEFPVAQIGPDFVVLESPLDLSPTHAELVVEIDHSEKRRTVFLPRGIHATDCETPIAFA